MVIVAYELTNIINISDDSKIIVNTRARLSLIREGKNDVEPKANET